MFHCLSFTCRSSTSLRSARWNSVAVSPSLGIDSVRMYSHWTGPNPGGGAYCRGKPGDGSTVVRYASTAPRPASTDNPSSTTTWVTDCPRIRSNGNGHGTSVRAGVGMSMPARRVTGVRGCRPLARNVTVSPRTVRSVQPRPAPKPTEHCAPTTFAGNVTVMFTRSMTLFQDGAMTFQ